MSPHACHGLTTAAWVEHQLECWTFLCNAKMGLYHWCLFSLLGQTRQCAQIFFLSQLSRQLAAQLDQVRGRSGDRMLTSKESCTESCTASCTKHCGEVHWSLWSIEMSATTMSSRECVLVYVAGEWTNTSATLRGTLSPNSVMLAKPQSLMT